MLRKATQIVKKAWDEGNEVVVWIREKRRPTGEDEQGIAVHSAIGNPDDDVGMDDESLVELSVIDDLSGHAACPGTVGDGEYTKLKTCIAIDSGSSAVVLLEAWPLGLAMKPPNGSLAVQASAGAAGETTANTGHKKVDFLTDAGQQRGMAVQCADVNKPLTCVAGIAGGPRNGTTRTS